MLEKNDVTEPKPELRMSRVFEAKRRLVFEAWTKAEHVSRWFAPRPLTVVECELDFRVGGVFNLVMVTPDGKRYPMVATFREVVVPERIVFDAVIHDDNRALTTLTFTEIDGKTRLDVHQVYSFESPATRGAQQGWTATLDQLGEHVAR